jgi:hypothetical protein
MAQGRAETKTKNPPASNLATTLFPVVADETNVCFAEDLTSALLVLASM